MKLSRSVALLAFGLTLSTIAFADSANKGDITLYEDTVQALELENAVNNAVSNDDLGKPNENSGKSDVADTHGSQEQNEHGVVVSGLAQVLVDGARDKTESGDVEFKDAIRKGATALSYAARENSEEHRSDAQESIDSRRDDASSLAEEASSIGETIKNDVQELADDAAEQAVDSSQAAAELAETAQNAASDAKANALDLVAAAKDHTP